MPLSYITRKYIRDFKNVSIFHSVLSCICHVITAGTKNSKSSKDTKNTSETFFFLTCATSAKWESVRSLWIRHWFYFGFPRGKQPLILSPEGEGGGGGYSHTLPTLVCAAQRGRDFKAPDLERGIHFKGVS